MIIGDRLAGLHEFVARRDHHDRGLAADAHARHAGGGDHRDFRRPKQGTGLEQQCALATIGAAPVHVREGCRRCRRLDRRETLEHVNQFHGHDTIAADRQRGARHDFDGVVRTRKFQSRRASRLHGLDPEALRALARGGAIDRDAVHGDAIERRLITLGVNILAQGPAHALRQWQRFDRQTRQPRVDRLFGQTG